MRARLFFAAGLCLAVGLGWLFGADKDPAPETKYLLNRLWVERLPSSERDLVHYLVAIEERENIGSVALASRWRVQADMFRFRLDGDRLHTRWPQDRKKASFLVRTRECEAQAPFTLCLDLKERSGRKMRFYSREDWHLDEPGSLPAWAPRLDDELVVGEGRLDDCAECSEGRPLLLP